MSKPKIMRQCPSAKSVVGEDRSSHGAVTELPCGLRADRRAYVSRASAMASVLVSTALWLLLVV